MTEYRQDSVLQNLRDAGCDGSTTRQIITELDAGRTTNCLRLLAAHRRHLLDQLHQDERCIDCLDYLVYELERSAAQQDGTL